MTGDTSAHEVGAVIARGASWWDRKTLIIHFTHPSPKLKTRHFPSFLAISLLPLWWPVQLPSHWLPFWSWRMRYPLLLLPDFRGGHGSSLHIDVIQFLPTSDHGNADGLSWLPLDKDTHGEQLLTVWNFSNGCSASDKMAVASYNTCRLSAMQGTLLWDKGLALERSIGTATNQRLELTMNEGCLLLESWGKST